MTPGPEVPTSVPAWWRDLMERHGSKDLVSKEGEALTYGQVDERSANLARGLLAQGVGKGSRVGILMPNGPEWIIAWLATQRIGALGVTLSTFFTARELAYAVRNADVGILLASRSYLRNDYVARLEEAFPTLATHDGKQDLAASECPFLRSAWIVDDDVPSWARGSLADLEKIGEASTLYTPALLAAVESEVAPSDLGIMIYTSGSTALPKGVVHNQAASMSKVAFLMSTPNMIPANTHEGDRLLVVQPYFWVGGFLTLVGCIMVGATVLCEDDHKPERLLEAIRRDKPTHVTGTPASLKAIMACKDYKEGELSGLKASSSSQRAFNPQNVPGNARIWDSLGMTETMGPHSGYPSGDPSPPQAMNSWGKSLFKMEYKIVDTETREPVGPNVPGELCVRGPWLMEGFYKKLRREVFDADGYYPTGDKCYLDDEGYLYFQGRLGGMIKTAGANVSPEEVEEVIRLQPGVVDVAVYPVPDEKLGQMVVAVVAMTSDAGMDEAGLKAALKGELSAFKVPKRILFLPFEEFPRTPSNKIRRPALAAMMEPRLAKETAS